eukprot:3983-Heterococcus_DN1.PRE.2
MQSAIALECICVAATCVTPFGQRFLVNAKSRRRAMQSAMALTLQHVLELKNTLDTILDFDPLKSNPTTDQINGYKDPLSTNLHLHGVHISGTAPADDFSTVVKPGETGIYTYAIPCDHIGGTYWYHANHHGSLALQATAGSAGVLIIENNVLVEGTDAPDEYLTMPEAVMMIMEMAPDRTRQVAELSKDPLYECGTYNTFFLVNGCLDLKMPVEATQWTKLRIAFVGQELDYFLDLTASTGEVQCDVALISKDGVFLQQ